MTHQAHTYRVNEIFYSLQGEGFHTGTPAVFLRFSGCNLACSFCDTDFAAYREMTADDILDEISRFPARHLVVTGGEPSLQLDESLLARLHAAAWFVQVETNGTRQLPAGVDWITCSPKGDAPVVLEAVDELKIVYQSQDVEAVAARCPSAPHMFLQPCSGLNVADTISYILDHPWWRLSLQTHKIVDIR